MGEERPCRGARLNDEPEKRGRREPAQYDLAAALSLHRPVSPRLLGTLFSLLPDACHGVALLDLLVPDLPTSALLIPYNLLLRSTCHAGCSASPPASSWRCGTEGSPPTCSRTPRSSRHSPARATSTTRSPSCCSWRTTPWLPTSCSSPTSSTSPFAGATRPRRSRSSPAFGAPPGSSPTSRPTTPPSPPAGSYASYSPILAALARRGRHLTAVLLFTHMRVKPNLSVLNIVLNAYGQLDLAREADRLFWSMRRAGVAPSVVTYNTMLHVYGDARLFGEAVHLFGLMRSAASDGSNRGGSIIKPNVVTYNTMNAIYGKSLEDEKDGAWCRTCKPMALVSRSSDENLQFL
uniref:Pentatricopeptide repeat-containing protein n=1 Tax=Oryza meridionalis TaxID=40149 RepID=A0A0E0CCT2_9ORYZ